MHRIAIMCQDSTRTTLDMYQTSVAASKHQQTTLARTIACQWDLIESKRGLKTRTQQHKSSYPDLDRSCKSIRVKTYPAAGGRSAPQHNGIGRVGLES
jgi:hypothetical protein